MTNKDIREWLSEYKSLGQEEFDTYVATIRQKEDPYNAICTLFEGDLTNEYIEPVCHQLFDFFKAGHIELRRFTLDLLPTLVYTYLTAVSRGEKRKCSGLEACLLGIYNLEVVSEDGSTPKTNVFTIPTLAVPSIYHEPPSLATLALTESSLLRYHSDQPVTVTLGPLPQEETLNSQNRLAVLRYIMSRYNADIKHVEKRSQYTLCKVCARLAKHGFERIDDIGVAMLTIDLNDSMSSASSRSSRRSVKFSGQTDYRIPLDAAFLTELLTGLYFTMFNGQPHLSIEAVNFIHKRASYERFTDVLLVTNAIRNSLQYNPSGQPQDGPMGIAVALSPYQRDEKFSKHAITNASFRGKRLPEDIQFLPGTMETIDDSPEHVTRVDTQVLVQSAKLEQAAEKIKIIITEDKTSSLAKENKRKISFRDKITKMTKRSNSMSDKKDIEPVTGDGQTDLPPHYDDLEADKSSVKDSAASESKPKETKAHMIEKKLEQLSQPLKSIMKKNSDREKDKPEKAAKVHRKSESENPTSKEKKSKQQRENYDRTESVSGNNSPKSPTKHHSGATGSTNSTGGAQQNHFFPVSQSYNNGDITDPTHVFVHVTDNSSSQKRTVTLDNFELASMTTTSPTNHNSALSSLSYDSQQNAATNHLQDKMVAANKEQQRVRMYDQSSDSSKESLNTHL